MFLVLNSLYDPPGKNSQLHTQVMPWEMKEGGYFHVCGKAERGQGQKILEVKRAWTKGWEPPPTAMATPQEWLETVRNPSVVSIK